MRNVHKELRARGIVHASRLPAGGVSTQTLLRRVQGGPFPSLLIFLSHLPLNHSEDTSVFGLLLTCMRSFHKLNLYKAKKKKKAFSLIRSEMIALQY